jgi:hypothetical protein
MNRSDYTFHTTRWANGSRKTMHQALSSHSFVRRFLPPSNDVLHVRKRTNVCVWNTHTSSCMYDDHSYERNAWIMAAHRRLKRYTQIDPWSEIFNHRLDRRNNQMWSENYSDRLTGRCPSPDRGKNLLASHFIHVGLGLTSSVAATTTWFARLFAWRVMH